MKPTPQKNDENLFLRISSELRQRLVAQAAREDRNMTQMARIALVAGLAARESIPTEPETLYLQPQAPSPSRASDDE